MIKKIIFTYIVMVLPVVSSYGLTIQAGVASREVHSDTSTVYRNTTGTWDVVTQPFQEPDSGGRCVVLAFRLPEIPEGKIVKSAKFSLYYVDCSTERVGPNDSVYAIPYRSESSIMIDDYYEGDFCGDMDAYAVGSDIVDFDVTGAWNISRTLGSRRLTRFLRKQYKNGAQGNEWFFLRINSEYDGYNYYSRHSYASVYYNGGTQWSPSPFAPYIEYELVDESELVVDESVESGKVPEFTPNIDPALIEVPIQQESYFLCEVERLGYNPRYPVNSPQFDSLNRPYIRQKFAVSTLNSETKWITLNFKKYLYDAFPQWDGTLVSFGPASDDRIVFDNNDDAYMLITVSGVGEVLMHSRDYCRSWDVIPLFEMVATATMEFRGGHNNLVYPPTIVTRTYTASGGAAVLDLITPVKETDGTIRIPSLIPINRGTGYWISVLGGGLNVGKGSANLSVSFGDMVHVVFAGRYTVNEEPGTPQYIASYNRSTKQTTPVVYLASAGIGEPDEHNWPGVSLDSQGYVHAVLGAHGGKSGQCFKYSESLSPNDSTQMSASVNLPSGFTYLSLLCDKEDSLHVVARDHWDPYVQKLKYMKKQGGQSWPTEKDELVVPFFVAEAEYTYNRYDQTLDIDRKGNLYITYWNGSNVVIGDTVAEEAFMMKWPNEEFVHTTEGEWTSDIYHDMRSADSRRGAILVSKDNGESWKLVETKDFVELSGTMAALPQTREVRGSAGPVENTGGTWQVVTSDTTCDPVEHAYSILVMAFQIPDLPDGYGFTFADMNWYYHYQKRWGGPIDAYGLGFRTGVTPDITSDDFYIGYNDTTDATLIDTNVIDFKFGLSSWESLSSIGESNFADYLNQQIAAGAKTGDWILIRLNVEYRYTEWYSAHTIRSCYYADSIYTPYIEYKVSPLQ